jgi:hypothetical protein
MRINMITIDLFLALQMYSLFMHCTCATVPLAQSLMTNAVKMSKDMKALSLQSQRSEIEFLVEVSRYKLESSQTRVLAWFSTLIFPFYKMLFMNTLELSCFMDFL